MNCVQILKSIYSKKYLESEIGIEERSSSQGGKMTNFKRIKSMNEKELAHFLTTGGCYYCCSELYNFCRSYDDKSAKCKTVVKKWLESETKIGGNKI